MNGLALTALIRLCLGDYSCEDRAMRCVDQFDYYSMEKSESNSMIFDYCYKKELEYIKKQEEQDAQKNTSRRFLFN